MYISNTIPLVFIGQRQVKYNDVSYAICASQQRFAIALTRAGSGVMDVWPLRLQDSLPIIPVPL